MREYSDGCLLFTIIFFRRICTSNPLVCEDRRVSTVKLEPHGFSTA